TMGRANAPGCQSGRWPESRRSDAPAATDRLALLRLVVSPPMQSHRQPCARKFDGELSWHPPRAYTHPNEFGGCCEPISVRFRRLACRRHVAAFHPQNVGMSRWQLCLHPTRISWLRTGDKCCLLTLVEHCRRLQRCALVGEGQT